MAILSSYYWAGFPFDNLCENEDQQAPANYFGDHAVLVDEDANLASIIASYTGQNATLSSDFRNFTVPENATTYSFCNQNLVPRTGIYFPFIPFWQEELGYTWMTEGMIPVA